MSQKTLLRWVALAKATKKEKTLLVRWVALAKVTNKITVEMGRASKSY